MKTSKSKIFVVSNPDDVMTSEKDLSNVGDSQGAILETEQLNLGEKILRVVRNITVEPVVLCYTLPLVLSSLAVLNMNLEKACRVSEDYGDEVCTKLINQDVGNLTAEELQVQTLVANMMAWKIPLQTFIPGIMLLFIGAWSDRNAKRRNLMVFPLVGELVSSIGLILCTYFFLEWPLEVAGVWQAIPPALSGGWATLYMATFSYMTEITSLKERTFRIGILNVFVTVGAPIGTALSGVLTRELGYYGVFSIAIMMYSFGIFYGLVRIKDNKKDLDKSDRVNFCVDLFNPVSVKDTIMVAFKRRNGTGRLRVFLLLLIFVFLTGPIHGETAVTYLFSRYRFNFTEVDYSIYSTYTVTLSLIGTICAITIITKYTNIDDTLIGVMAGLCKIIACFFYAFAPTVGWYYLAPVVDIFSGLGIIAMRSLATKIVDPDETGKIYSLFGACEAFVPVIFCPLYIAVYVATIEVIPGAFYLLGGLVTIPVVTSFAIMYILQKRDEKSEPKPSIDSAKSDFTDINLNND